MQRTVFEKQEIREKVIVNSFVVLDRPKSAPSDLPRETAIKVRIAEFFVHHASRGKRYEWGEKRTYCMVRYQQTSSGGRRTSAVVARKAEDEEKRCCRERESELGLGGGSGMHGPCPSGSSEGK
jgi:hypothetical protein